MGLSRIARGLLDDLWRIGAHVMTALVLIAILAFDRIATIVLGEML